MKCYFAFFHKLNASIQEDFKIIKPCDYTIKIYTIFNLPNI